MSAILRGKRMLRRRLFQDNGALLLKRPLQKRANLVAREIFEWERAERVVTTGKDRDIVIPIVPARALDDLPREVNGKRGVVTRIDELRALLFLREAIPIT